MTTPFSQRWPYQRATNFAIALGLPKPDGYIDWSYEARLKALADYIHVDMATLLAMDSVDYAIRTPGPKRFQTHPYLDAYGFLNADGVYDYNLWPSPRAKNFAILIGLPKPEGRRSWSHSSALQALADYIRVDMATLLAMHPVEYAMRSSSHTMRLLSLLPKDVKYGYRGPLRQTHSWIFH